MYCHVSTVKVFLYYPFYVAEIEKVTLPNGLTKESIF